MKDMEYLEYGHKRGWLNEKAMNLYISRLNGTIKNIERNERMLKETAPGAGDEPRKKGNAMCGCGHSIVFHDTLDNLACHEMECNCDRFTQKK